MARLPTHAPFTLASGLSLSPPSGLLIQAGFSFTPGLAIMGIEYMAAGTFGTLELGMGKEHDRRAGAQPDGGDAFGMERGHDIGPDAAAGVSPETPGNGRQFRMPGLGGEIGEGLEKQPFPNLAADRTTTPKPPA